MATTKTKAKSPSVPGGVKGGVQNDNPLPHTPPSPNVPYPNTLDGTINPLLLPDNADATAGGASEVTIDGHIISETTTVATPLAEQPERTIEASANLLLEYVSALGASYAPWLGTGYIRQLPTPSDQLMQDFGTRLYDDDMTRDAQVYSVLSILCMAVLAEGVRLEPCKTYDDPDYPAAKRIADFCQYNLENTKHPFIGILYEALEGMLKMGHKTGEMIFDVSDDPKATGESNTGPKVVLTDIKLKAHGATAFVVDGFDNTLGLLYVRPGMSMPVLGTLLVGQTDMEGALPNMAPKPKFFIPTHKPRNGDPRGTSHLKAVYTPWWQKLQWVPQHLAYVARFAQPSIWIKLPPEAKDIPVLDNTGNIVKYKSIVQASTDAGVKLKGGAVATFINADANLMEAKGDAKVIFDSYDFSDRQIAKGVLMQTLTTEEGQHMARAASSIHQDVFGILIAYLRNILVWHIQNEILKLLVTINFGEDEARTLTPRVSLGDTEQQDLPALINALAALALAGGIHPSQWPGIWEKLGFPKVNEEEWKVDQQILEAQREQNLKIAKNPTAMGLDPLGNPLPPPPAKGVPTPGIAKGPADQVRKKPPTRESKINSQ